MGNYERMWCTLKGYLQYLESRGVQSVSPVVVSHEMDTIYDLEDKDDQIDNASRVLAEAGQKGD
jgi:hypothetical protein